jgi:hypothetical protein
MAKTLEELTVELAAIEAREVANKKFREHFDKEWIDYRIEREAIKAAKTALQAEMSVIKGAEKANKKSAQLQELLKAKEAAAALGVKIAAKNEEKIPVAAHLIDLDGPLDEPVILDDLEKELDIF